MPDTNQEALEIAATYLRRVAALGGPRKPEEAEPTAAMLIAKVAPIIEAEVLERLARLFEAHAADAEARQIPDLIVRTWRDAARAALDQEPPGACCPTCDDTGFVCAECRKPRSRCDCGLDGASENGCPKGCAAQRKASRRAALDK